MNDISERAMLVSLNLSVWTARKYDDRVTRDVLDKHHASEDAGRFNKRLVAKSAMSRISRVCAEARRFYYANTLPWGQDGSRILPVDNYWDFMQGMSKLREQFECAVADFVDAYPSMVEARREQLNGMFNQNDYPDELTVRSRFVWDCAVLPLPSQDDFRVKLSANQTAFIKRDIEERVRKSIDASVRDLWQRVHDTLVHTVDRLNNYTGEREGAFRDSLVGNLAELAGLLDRLNVTGDADLHEAAKAIRSKMASVPPQVLRDSESKRKAVAQAAQDILSKMGPYLGTAA